MMPWQMAQAPHLRASSDCSPRETSIQDIADYLDVCLNPYRSGEILAHYMNKEILVIGEVAIPRLVRIAMLPAQVPSLPVLPVLLVPPRFDTVARYSRLIHTRSSLPDAEHLMLSRIQQPWTTRCTSTMLRCDNDVCAKDEAHAPLYELKMKHTPRVTS